MEDHRQHPQRQRDQHVIFERGADHQVERRLGGVEELEAGAAEQAAINDRRPQQVAELGGGVNAAAPDAAAEGIEAFRVLAHQQGLRLAVAALLFQIGADGRAPIMPDKRRRAETDLASPPAASASTGPRRRPPGGRSDRTRRSAPAPTCRTPCCSRGCAPPGGRSASRAPARRAKPSPPPPPANLPAAGGWGRPCPQIRSPTSRPPDSRASPRPPGSRSP